MRHALKLWNCCVRLLQQRALGQAVGPEEQGAGVPLILVLAVGRAGDALVQRLDGDGVGQASVGLGAAEKLAVSGSGCVRVPVTVIPSFTSIPERPVTEIVAGSSRIS